MLIGATQFMHLISVMLNNLFILNFPMTLPFLGFYIGMRPRLHQSCLHAIGLDYFFFFILFFLIEVFKVSNFIDFVSISQVSDSKLSKFVLFFPLEAKICEFLICIAQSCIFMIFSFVVDNLILHVVYCLPMMLDKLFFLVFCVADIYNFISNFKKNECA